MGGARLWMVFRVGSHFDMEMLTMFSANELDQLIGKSKLPHFQHAGRDVAAQSHNMADAMVAVFVEDGADIVATGANARQMRRSGVAFAADLQHGVQRAVTGGAASAKGHGKKLRLELGQLLAGGTQLGHALRGFGREELKAEGAGIRL